MFSYCYENLKRVAETPKGKAFLEQVEKEYLSTYDGKVNHPQPAWLRLPQIAS